MTTDNTTPRPWALTHKQGSNFAVQEFEIRGMFGDNPNTYPIFNKDRYAINGTTVNCSPQDAELIVRAVNSHDALVEALELVEEAMRKGKIEDASFLDLTSSKEVVTVVSVHDVVKKALAQAKGD